MSYIQMTNTQQRNIKKTEKKQTLWKQVVKVICHKAALPCRKRALPLHTDGSVFTFARWRQCAPYLIHSSPDQLCHLCMAHDNDRQTYRDWPSDHATPFVTISRIYVVLCCGGHPDSSNIKNTANNQLHIAVFTERGQLSLNVWTTCLYCSSVIRLSKDIVQVTRRAYNTQPHTPVN